MTPIEGPSSGLNSAVAAQLRAERAAQNLTVQELAAKSDVPYASLRRYLSAERHIDVAVLSTLAAALGTTAPDLVWAANERLLRGVVVEVDFSKSSESADSVDLATEPSAAEPKRRDDGNGDD